MSVNSPPSTHLFNQKPAFFFLFSLSALSSPIQSICLCLVSSTFNIFKSDQVKLRMSFFQVSGARFYVGSTPLPCLLFMPSPCRTHICQPISKSSFSHLNNCLSRLTSLPTSNLSPKPLYQSLLKNLWWIFSVHKIKH